MNEDTPLSANNPLTPQNWFDPLEEAVRQQIRAFIEQVVEEELTEALGRCRYGRTEVLKGYRHGHRPRQVWGTFGQHTVSVPRARLEEVAGGQREWKSQALRAYKRLTHRAEALIASTYLAGCNSRRVRRALAGLFQGAVGKDSVSRAWRKVQTHWAQWSARDLSQESMVRLILDGTAVTVRLDGKATAISLLVALGVRRDGQKVLLAVRNLGGESEAAWRVLLEDLLARGLTAPAVVIVDGGKGLEAALARLWPQVPVQRCTVHKERNLLAHAPKSLHDELKADYTAMMYAKTARAVRQKRRAFLNKWRAKCPAVAVSLEEAGEPLFTFLAYPPEQWKSLRTTNAIERLHEEFKRRIKTQCVVPAAETAAMLFWALLAGGQITLRRVDGWQTLDQPPARTELDLAA